MKENLLLRTIEDSLIVPANISILERNMSPNVFSIIQQ